MSEALPLLRGVRGVLFKIIGYHLIKTNYQNLLNYTKLLAAHSCNSYQNFSFMPC
jgi:hypothetical protein